jgi:endoglucanase
MNQHDRFSRHGLLCVLFTSCCLAVTAMAQPPESTRKVAANTAKVTLASMDVGYNLGNTFDLQINNLDEKDICKLIDLYVSVNCKHIRIPVTWIDGFNGDLLVNNNGKLLAKHPRFLLLKKTIDYAISKKLYVILNTHHEKWLKDNYDGTANIDNKFQSLWTEIAKQFEKYPPQLIFEVLNEPDGALGQWDGKVKPNNPQAVTLTRQINDVGYKAIRATGGKNTTRVILISPNGQGNHSQLKQIYPSKESLPGGGNDTFLAATVHTYDPYDFCGPNGTNAKYPGDQVVAQAIQDCISHATKIDLPIHYGEFGVGREKNPQTRDTQPVREYYWAIRQATKAANVPCAFWDDRGWFGMVELNKAGRYTFVFDLVPSMLGNARPKR